MMRKMAVFWAVFAVAVAAVVAGCGGKKKKKTATGAGAGAGAGAGGGGTGAAAPPRKLASTAELWALAPEGASIGFVIGDGVLLRAQGDVKGLLAVISKHPLGKQAVDGALADMQRDAQVDVFDAAAIKAKGIDLGKGVAVYAAGRSDDDKGHAPLLAVLPVGDRAAFRTLAKAKVETVDGVEFDRLHPDKDDAPFCAPSGDRYLCAPSAAAWKAIKPGNTALAAAALAAAERGDIELHIDAKAFQTPKFQRAMDKLRHAIDVSALRGTAILEPSGVTMTFDVLGAPGPMARLIAGAPPPKQFLVGGALTGLWRLHVEPELLLMRAPPAMPTPLGIDLRADLLEKLSGDFLQVSGPGAKGGSMLAAVRDEAKVRDLVRSVCKLVSVKMPGTEATPDGCAVKLPAGAMPGMPAQKIDVRVKDGTLGVVLGDPPKAGDPGELAGSIDARRVLTEPANLAGWARGWDIMGTLPREALGALNFFAPRKAVAALEAVSIVGLHLYEVAARVAVAGDGAHFLLRVTTFGGDPAPARAAYLAAVDKRIKGDEAGYKSALAALEKAHPGTLVAQQAALVREGYIALGAGTGMVAAIGAATFMKMKKRAARVGP